MRCEECLPLIEEYVDGELEGRTGASVATHLSACTECAREFAELRREQEIYASYQRDIEVTPAQWNIVRARIEQERDARPARSRTRRREWLAAALGAGWRFKPAFVAALVLIIVGITVSLIYLNSRHRPTEVAAGIPKQNETQPTKRADEAVVPVKENGNDNAAARDDNRETDNANPQRAADNGPRIPVKKKDALLVKLPKPENRRIKQPAPDESTQFYDVVADRDNTVTAVRQNGPDTPGDFDFEVARHTEKAQLLLRSFRNVRSSTGRRALDVSYEKESARKLLYQNIALRRDAASRGDEPVADLLNTLEPILLDIAHLPDRAAPRDVRSIEERMEKKEIVAALQVRTLVASN